MPVAHAPLDYDPFAPEVIADPYPWYPRLQDEAPLYHQKARDFWVVSRYEDVLAGARAHGTLSSSEGVTYTRMGVPMMLSMDPPDHTRLRRLVSRDFTPTAVNAWAPLVDQLVEELVDDMVERQTVDVVDDLAAPFPVTVIADVLGVPRADQAQFRIWSDAIVEGLAVADASDTERASRCVQGITQLQAYLADLVAQRRDESGDDMLSKLTHPRDGGTLGPQELFWFCLLLLVAGNETTTNLIGNLLLTLLGDPALWDRLRAQRGLVPGAVEESVRRDSPIQGLFRTALEPYTVAGATVPAGGRVLLLFGAANRDRRHYDDPDRFDPERATADHVGFGSGIHLCLGAHLARLEGRAVLTRLLERVQRLEPAGEPVRGTNPALRGMARLPMTLVPA
jgi:beta-dihydromenaquinone-9 omega-hydroxylase